MGGWQLILSHFSCFCLKKPSGHKIFLAKARRSQNYAFFGQRSIFAKARRSQKYAFLVKAMPLGFYCDPEPNLNQS